MSKYPATVSPPHAQPNDHTNRVIAVVAALLDTPEAAVYMNYKPATLEQWRWNGRGPLFVKIGRSVRYRISDLDNFLSERVFSNTTEAQAANKGECNEKQKTQ